MDGCRTHIERFGDFADGPAWWGKIKYDWQQLTH